MKNALKLLVITENGRIVGTQFQSPPGPTPAVSTRLQVGPGQRGHEIEIEPPASLRTIEQIMQFHEAVAKVLGPAKLFGPAGNGQST